MKAYFGPSVDVNNKSILIAVPNVGDIPTHFGDLAHDAKEEGMHVMAVVANDTDGRRYDHEGAMKELEIHERRYLDVSDNALHTPESQARLSETIAAYVNVRRVGSIATFGPNAHDGNEKHDALHRASITAQKMLAAAGVCVPILALGENGYDVIMPEVTIREAHEAFAA